AKHAPHVPKMTVLIPRHSGQSATERDGLTGTGYPPPVTPVGPLSGGDVNTVRKLDEGALGRVATRRVQRSLAPSRPRVGRVSGGRLGRSCLRVRPRTPRRVAS